jgi:hypothetical protein
MHARCRANEPKRVAAEIAEAEEERQASLGDAGGFGRDTAQCCVKPKTAGRA